MREWKRVERREISMLNVLPPSCTRCIHYTDMENGDDSCTGAVCCKFKIWFPFPFHTPEGILCLNSEMNYLNTPEED